MLIRIQRRDSLVVDPKNMRVAVFFLMTKTSHLFINLLGIRFYYILYTIFFLCVPHTVKYRKKIIIYVYTLLFLLFITINYYNCIEGQNWTFFVSCINFWTKKNNKRKTVQLLQKKKRFRKLNCLVSSYFYSSLDCYQ